MGRDAEGGRKGRGGTESYRHQENERNQTRDKIEVRLYKEKNGRRKRKERHRDIEKTGREGSGPKHKLETQKTGKRQKKKIIKLEPVILLQGQQFSHRADNPHT